VRRGQSAPELEATSTSVADQTAEIVARAPQLVANFSLELLGLRCARALVIGELPLPEDRRIARDVLGTLNGFTEEESVQTPFHWPQSSRGEQGREAATSALEAFIRGQVERAGVHVIVLFGETLRQLLFPGLEARDQRVQFLDAQCVLTGSTEQLRNSAERKRSLWQCILTIPGPI